MSDYDPSESLILPDFDFISGKTVDDKLNSFAIRFRILWLEDKSASAFMTRLSRVSKVG